MRWAIYLTVLLLVVLFVVRQCARRDSGPREAVETPASAPAVYASTPVPAASANESAAPQPAAVSAPPPSAPGTPEPDLAAPQVNDPVEPEQPQTPEWKLDRTVHLEELVSRHLDRLERERVAAHAAGNAEEEFRLGVAIRRGRARLEHLQGEAALLRQEMAH